MVLTAYLRRNRGPAVPGNCPLRGCGDSWSARRPGVPLPLTDPELERVRLRPADSSLAPAGPEEGERGPERRPPGDPVGGPGARANLAAHGRPAKLRVRRPRTAAGERGDRLMKTPPWPLGDAVIVAADALPATAPTAFVDANGRSHHRRVEVAHAGVRWTFLFHPDDKAGVRFRGGLFLDRAAVSGRHLDRVPRPRRAAALLETPNDPFFAHAPPRGRGVRRHPDAPAVAGGRRGTVPAVGLRHAVDPRRRPGRDRRRLAETGGRELLRQRRAPRPGWVRPPPRVAAALAGRGVDCFGNGFRLLPHKVDGIAPYRFSVAMENARSPGY